MKTEEITIGTIERTLSEIDRFLFPSDIFNVPGIKSITDISVIESYADKQIKKWQNKKIKLIITGGLTVANVAAINAAARHQIIVDVLHRNRVDGTYFSQKMIFPTKSYSLYKEKIKLKVCDQRHSDIPGKPIFESIPKQYLTDISWLEERAKEIMEQYQKHQVILYVTGLTQALFAVINATVFFQIPTILMNFNFETECYFEQPIYSNAW